ncbi:hypothetical protein BDR06DRAFT_969421 [Suillus hirtellus]|nr:hypothetical protein BDR06DRAFT_969421 [Suillus hirtellus]
MDEVNEPIQLLMRESSIMSKFHNLKVNTSAKWLPGCRICFWNCWWGTRTMSIVLKVVHFGGSTTIGVAMLFQMMDRCKSVGIYIETGTKQGVWHFDGEVLEDEVRLTKGLDETEVKGLDNRRGEVELFYTELKEKVDQGNITNQFQLSFNDATLV